MKKINPKVTSLVIMLLSMLIAGGAIAANEIAGQPGLDNSAGDDTDTGI